MCGLIAFLLCILWYSNANLVAVMLTTGKDTRVFEKSVRSAIQHLLDVEKYYVITPDANGVKQKLQSIVGDKVVFVDENSFPFTHSNVSDIMIRAVKDKGVYPLSGNSQFERTIWGRTGWFLQQLLKMYAGKVLELEDYVLLDSDLVWFQDITFLNSTSKDGVKRYNYASSSQYHPPYMASLIRIAGVSLYESPDKVFRSGICHHMVIVKKVLDDLMKDAETIHGGIPFWQVLLNESALEMTCRAPKEGICGAGSTLSEYELYFNYARSKHPETVNIRPLLWANGPAPGLQYWPSVEENKIFADRHKQAWLGHRQSEGICSLFIIHPIHSHTVHCFFDSHESTGATNGSRWRPRI